MQSQVISSSGVGHAHKLHAAFTAPAFNLAVHTKLHSESKRPLMSHSTVSIPALYPSLSSQVDFGYFGPPEEHYKWTKEKREGTYVNADDPSSEVGGEIAAALAAASVALRQTDPAYADKLVVAAKLVCTNVILPITFGAPDYFEASSFRTLDTLADF